MIFAEEPIASLIEEMTPLLEKHYREIAWNKEKIPLDVDWDGYKNLEAIGKFVCYTARADGVLVGYSAYIVGHHLHYRQTIYAQNDVIYIHPVARGKAGAKFIAWCEEKLKARGAQVHGLHIKDSNDWSPLAIRMGFSLMDRIYMKWIGE